MKAGKKIATKAQKRSIRHNIGIEARKKKGIDDNRGYKEPGSRNKKKT